MSDGHEVAGDDGPRERRGEGVDVLVERVGVQRGGHEVVRELLLGVHHDDLGRAVLPGPRDGVLQVVQGLAHVHQDADDVDALVLAQPVDHDAGVEAAGVSEDRLRAGLGAHRVAMWASRG